METVHWHRHVGVYGICIRNNELLVIHKNGGPYTGRYDLPGGSIEPNESLIGALHREFHEETGIAVSVVGHVGTRDYVLPWIREGYSHTHCQHIALFYEVLVVAGDVADSPRIDDSNGAEWLDLANLNGDNSSPLVMQAVDWTKSRSIPVQTEYFEDWIIYSK